MIQHHSLFDQIRGTKLFFNPAQWSDVTKTSTFLGKAKYTPRSFGIKIPAKKEILYSGNPFTAAGRAQRAAVITKIEELGFSRSLAKKDIALIPAWARVQRFEGLLTASPTRGILWGVRTEKYLKGKVKGIPLRQLSPMKESQFHITDPLKTKVKAGEFAREMKRNVLTNEKGKVLGEFWRGEYTRAVRTQYVGTSFAKSDSIFYRSIKVPQTQYSLSQIKRAIGKMKAGKMIPTKVPTIKINIESGVIKTPKFIRKGYSDVRLGGFKESTSYNLRKFKLPAGKAEKARVVFSNKIKDFYQDPKFNVAKVKQYMQTGKEGEVARIFVKRQPQAAMTKHVLKKGKWVTSDYLVKSPKITKSYSVSQIKGGPKTPWSKTHPPTGRIPRGLGPEPAKTNQLEDFFARLAKDKKAQSALMRPTIMKPALKPKIIDPAQIKFIKKPSIHAKAIERFRSEEALKNQFLAGESLKIKTFPLEKKQLVAGKELISKQLTAQPYAEIMRTAPERTIKLALTSPLAKEGIGLSLFPIADVAIKSIQETEPLERTFNIESQFVSPYVFQEPKVREAEKVEIEESTATDQIFPQPQPQPQPVIDPIFKPTYPEIRRPPTMPPTLPPSIFPFVWDKDDEEEEEKKYPKKKKKKKEKKKGFFVYVKKFKKPVRIYPKALTMGQALALGKEYALKTERATFQLVPTREAPVEIDIAPKTKKDVWDAGFRPPVRKGLFQVRDLTFVQRQRKRMTTKSEQKAIQSYIGDPYWGAPPERKKIKEIRSDPFKLPLVNNNSKKGSNSKTKQYKKLGGFFK